MITATRITRALGVLGAVGFLAHATVSLATTGASYQDAGLPPEPAPAASAVDDAPLPVAPEPLKDVPPAPPADAAPPPSGPEIVKDLPPAPDEPALDLADSPAAPILKSEPLGSIRPDAAPAASTPLPAEDPNPLPPARELTSSPTAAPPPALDDEGDRPASNAKQARRTTTPRIEPTDDPDAEARSFVERNRREAQEQLKALRAEAATLKGRLARVEAGIRRWETLADAMERSGQDKTAAATGDDFRAVRSRSVQYGVPLSPSGGVIIQSQPVTRSDFVPVPGPR